MCVRGVRGKRVGWRGGLVDAHFIAALEEADAEGWSAKFAGAEEGGDDGAVA